MKQTKHFKRTAFPLSAKSMVSLMLLLIAMLLPQGAWAENFISEVKISSESGNNGNNAKSHLTNNDYTLAGGDLNYGNGKDSWFIYLGYKKDTDASKAITGIMIVSGKDYLGDEYLEGGTKTLSYDGKTWYRSPAQGAADLNKGASGDYLTIFYTRDGNTVNGGKPLVSLSVAEETGLSGYTYAGLYKNGAFSANGSTNVGTSGAARYITYTTHTHTLADADYDATNHKYWCASCGYVSKYNAHEWQNSGSEKDPATCTTAAVHYQKCKYCGRTNDANHTYTSGSALGHNYGNGSWSWYNDGHSATCTRTCSNDANHKSSVSVTLGNGITSAQQVAPDCTTKGTTRYTATATVAGTKYTSTKDVQDIAALGHSYGAGVWSWADDGHSATCTRTCGRTGCTTNTTGHTSSKSVTLGNGITSAQQVAPKCTEMGTTRYTATATVEGTQYTSTKDVVDIAVAGHNIDLQTGYCQTTGCGADLRVTTSYRVPTYKTPGVASSGIASWQTVSDVKAIPLPASTTPQTWYSQYYVVQSGQTVSLSKGAICAGDVHLIVEDGATLNIKANAQNNAGIAVSGGSTSLTIYGQTANTGKLTSIPGKYGAAIGGNYKTDGANITINGADVVAGENPYYSAGLGGGYMNKGYNIIINGGNVTAQGHAAAGIGGGYQGEGHDIIINGGNVYAADRSSGYDGAGIGGGSEKNGYNITINDGHITAIGSEAGAGIGGGYQHSGYNITIAGGTIDARGGISYADGIGNGCGYDGSRYCETKNGYIKFGLKVGIMSGSTVIDNTYGDMFDVVHKKQYITTHIHDLVYNGNATCTTAGTMSAQCDQCNKTFEFEDPDHPSLGHNYTNNTLTPIEDGLYAYACDNGCGTHTDDHIIKDFNGAGNHLELTKDGEGNYSTSEDIIINDRDFFYSPVGFSSPVDFSAPSVTFNRNIVMDDGMYSFIVPFDIPADQAAELGKFYQYSKHEEGKVYFDDIEKIGEGEVEANTAYFFKPAKNITSITVDDAEIKATTSMPNAENPSAPGLYGTYSQIEIPVGAYGYGNMGFFIKAGTENFLRPFRAYLWLGSGASMDNARAFFGEEEANGIFDIDAESEHDTPAYDLSGQRVTDDYKGIVIKNGKKTMVR